MADDVTATEEAPEVATDDRREALLAIFTEELGDAVVGSHLKPGQGLWIRVATAAWAQAAEVARDKAGLRFFDFLSAIDWLPSPYGRYEDSSVDVPFPPPMPDRSAAVPGYTGGDTRLQVLASVAKPGTDERVLLKADVPDDDPRVATWIRSYAGAAWHEREAHEMFGIALRRERRPAQHLPPDGVRRAPAAQGVPPPRSRREAVARHRRRRAHARRRRRGRRAHRGRRRKHDRCWIERRSRQAQARSARPAWPGNAEAAMSR